MSILYVVTYLLELQYSIMLHCSSKWSNSSFKWLNPFWFLHFWSLMMPHCVYLNTLFIIYKAVQCRFMHHPVFALIANHVSKHSAGEKGDCSTRYREHMWQSVKKEEEALWLLPPPLRAPDLNGAGLPHSCSWAATLSNDWPQLIVSVLPVMQTSLQKCCHFLSFYI